MVKKALRKVFGQISTQTCFKIELPPSDKIKDMKNIS